MLTLRTVKVEYAPHTTEIISNITNRIQPFLMYSSKAPGFTLKTRKNVKLLRSLRNF